MFQDLPILITAVGSELAFAIIKACRLFNRQVRLIGCDMADDVLGKYWCDDFELIPSAFQEEEYIASLSNIVEQRGIKIIIPTADAEFPVISKYKDHFLHKFACHILVNEPEEIERFNDKWLAAKWYSSHNIAAPRTILADDLEKAKINLVEWEFPIIIKPRFGGGSRMLFKAFSWEDIVKFYPLVPEPIFQEYLSPDDEEYTAGTYRDSKNKVYVIVLKRTLKFGMTYTAETVKRLDLEEFCMDLILKSNLIGSNNIQFRVTKNGPKVLETNPRFSGTTGIRAHFGFNDVNMWITDVMHLEPIREPSVKAGKVLRYMHEEFILE
jgi:carbamoyl-phosphate synthase large subunit